MFIPSVVKPWLAESEFQNCQAILDSVYRFNQQVDYLDSLSFIQDSQLAELQCFHNQLIQQASQHLLDDEKLELDDEELDSIFVEALLLLPHYNQMVNYPGINYLDTVGSKSFLCFEPDPIDYSMQKIQRVFGLSSTEIEQKQDEILDQTQPLRDRHKIMQVLEKLFDLTPSHPDLQKNIHQLFVSFYPDTPFSVEQVKLIKTASALFFCLPFEIDKIPNWTQIKPHDQQQYLRFLRKIKSGEPFAHFPAFGPFKGEQTQTDLQKLIVEKSGLSSDTVDLTLTRMVNTLPIDDVDKFLIHDVWGHQWQECLLDFENNYVALASFSQPFSLQEKAEVFGEQVSFLSAFRLEAKGQIHFDESAFINFIDYEIYERSVVALTPVLAETLGDLVEYKFVLDHSDHNRLLPSSSHIKDSPGKLDLTLKDIHRCFNQATAIFDNWIRNGSVRMKTELKKHFPEAQDNDIEHLAQITTKICQNRLEKFYQADWNSGSLFGKSILNFLAIHASTHKIFNQLADRDFRDLLVLVMGVFFDRNPQKHLWLMDNFINQAFLTRWARWKE